ncbi:hypothetical protein [Litorihabitans aurantiacus]|uniref:hypothetical protein n=1 Tax=Litorihabitans aurantiacus TaxID=1930061 RepID=UPI0024E1360D|nr:hypothetical protein [Litorihabitans aurantiacus]
MSTTPEQPAAPEAPTLPGETVAPSPSPSAPEPAAAAAPATTAPSTGEAHSCEHCSGNGGAAPDPAERAREHLRAGRRRVVPRLLLGALGVAIAILQAVRHEQPVLAVALVVVAAGLVWVLAAGGGVVLGALLAARRAPWARLALGQVLATALAPVGALLIALALGLAGLPRDSAGALGDSTIDRVLPHALAAAAGWFLAAALAEVWRLVVAGRSVERQDEVGLRARAEAHALTPGALQRADVAALGVALAFGAITGVLLVLPWLVLILVPLAAAGAALAARPEAAAAPSSRSSAQPTS